MFLRRYHRTRDGKTTTYYALVESVRTDAGPRQRVVAHLGELSHDEQRRGALAAGRLADLAVLTQDFANVPTDEIGSIESLLTMVGGRIVYAAAPFAALEQEAER